jgi:secondary thiamine-phosphate synthase enzyme
VLTKMMIQTQPKESLVDITEQVREIVAKSGVSEGVCILFVPHTTAGLTLNSKMDPATHQDIINDVRRLVPTRVDFEHIYDTPADAAGHIKSTLVGATLSMIVTSGDLLLGGSQGILFCEYDGPRSRNIHIRIMNENCSVC